MLNEELQSCVFVLYGEPGVGKTYLSSLIPNTYFLRCEHRHRFIKTEGEDIHNWPEFGKAIEGLISEKELKYKTIVIDPISDAYEFCYEQQCKEEGIEDLSEISKGRGWKLIKARFRKPLRALTEKGYGLILICHNKIETLELRGKKKDKYFPDLDKTATKTLERMADFIGHMYVDFTEIDGIMRDARFVCFLPRDDMKAKDGADFSRGFERGILLEPKEKGWEIINKIFINSHIKENENGID